jgi:alpha-ketoglutarate-dependent taurine dioxygenase
MSATTSEAIQFTTLGGHMAVAAEGVDLARKPEPALAASLRQALLDHQVLCIRGQSIGPADFLAAITMFGTPQPSPRCPVRIAIPRGTANGWSPAPHGTQTTRSWPNPAL